MVYVVTLFMVMVACDVCMVPKLPKHGPLWSAKAKACLGKRHSSNMPIARETPLFEVWEVRGLGLIGFGLGV